MPVRLTVNGETWLEFMCTPEHLEALAVGFLYTEGLIEDTKGLVQVRVCPAMDNVDVWSTQPLAKPDTWRKTSGCAGGLTSAGHAMEPHTQELPDRPRGSPVQLEEEPIAAAKINEFIFSLFHEQRLHRQSGGVHASALSDGQQLLLFCEDIGRHNTLDKLAGRVLLENILAPRRVILTTGRISSEMLQKATRIGAGVLVSHTAPTSLAVQLANHWGLTLVGYARSERFNIYTHPERIEAR